MSLNFKQVNGYATPTKPFDVEDADQQPNLSFIGFAAMSRARMHATLSAIYPLPTKEDPAKGITDLKKLRKRKDQFITFWIDRFIARAPKVRQYFLEHSEAIEFTDPAVLQFLEVLPDGSLRRGSVGTLVHYSMPVESTDEDMSDIAVSQVEWEHNPQLQADVGEQWRLSRPAKLTTGELEALLAKVNQQVA
jgi:hypothetical protein